MESRYCVYNRTTDRFLSVGAIVVHTVIEPFEALELPADVKNVTAEWGLCVVPPEALSAKRFSIPIGVVYLDADQRVLQGFEWAPGEKWPEETVAGAATALALPSQSVISSRTHPGDQFIICAAEELVRHLARIPSVKNGHSPAPATPQETVSEPEPLLAAETETKSKKKRRVPMERVATPRIQEFNGRPDTPSHAPIAKTGPDTWQIDESYQRGNLASLEMRQTDLGADEIESVIAQVLQWSRPADGRMPAPDGVPTLDLSTILEQPLPELPAREEASGGAEDVEMDDEEEPLQIETLSETDDQGFAEHEAAKDEFDRHGIDSVVSQVLEWAEQTGRPVARSSGAAAQAQQPVQGSSGKHDAAREGNPNGRRPVIGANRKNGAGRTGQSRIGRWADEVTQPLTHGLKSKPVIRIKIRTNNPAQRQNGNGHPGPQTGFRLGAVLQKFKENGKGLLSVEGIHTLRSRFTKWLDSDNPRAKSIGPVDRRRSSRHALPDLIAYYWTGGTPQAHRVGDISCNGFYLLTDERWVPDTVIRMTLQRTGANNKEQAISVLSKVVRWDKDGVGHEFILSDSVNMRSGKHTSGKEKVREALQEFI